MGTNVIRLDSVIVLVGTAEHLARVLVGFLYGTAEYPTRVLVRHPLWDS